LFYILFSALTLCTEILQRREEVVDVQVEHELGKLMKKVTGLDPAVMKNPLVRMKAYPISLFFSLFFYVQL